MLRRTAKLLSYERKLVQSFRKVFVVGFNVPLNIVLNGSALAICVMYSLINPVMEIETLFSFLKKADEFAVKLSFYCKKLIDVFVVLG